MLLKAPPGYTWPFVTPKTPPSMSLSIPEREMSHCQYIIHKNIWNNSLASQMGMEPNIHLPWTEQNAICYYFFFFNIYSMYGRLTGLKYHTKKILYTHGLGFPAPQLLLLGASHSEFKSSNAPSHLWCLLFLELTAHLHVNFVLSSQEEIFNLTVSPFCFDLSHTTSSFMSGRSATASPVFCSTV